MKPANLGCHLPWNCHPLYTFLFFVLTTYWFSLGLQLCDSYLSIAFSHSYLPPCSPPPNSQPYFLFVALFVNATYMQCSIDCIKVDLLCINGNTLLGFRFPYCQNVESYVISKFGLCLSLCRKLLIHFHVNKSALIDSLKRC